jgi:L-seryl-tRNA(Ser) seleniumtransferase
MKQLLERSGETIARLIECEAATVTPGAAAAMALGTAACMAGDDQEKIAQLPHTNGIKDTVLIQYGHHYHYEHAVTVPGAKLVEVGGADGTTAADFERLLGPNVAEVLFVGHLDGAPGTLPLGQVIELAHGRGVPVLVDAAGRIYPFELFRSFTAAGADLVAFGAKYIGALNASGILAGRKDLVSAAVAHGFIGFETISWGHSFGRPLKLDRQTIVAVVTAMQEWFEMDHEQRIANFDRRLQAMGDELRGAPGVDLSVVPGNGPRPRVLRLGIDPNRARHDVNGLVNALWNGTPAIAVDREGDKAVIINPVTLKEEDDAVVASRLGQLLL